MSEQQQSPDLTTPENVAKGQQVYDQIINGDIKAQDVSAALNEAYGREG